MSRGREALKWQRAQRYDDLTVQVNGLVKYSLSETDLQQSLQ